jgi:hypothetical protein
VLEGNKNRSACIQLGGARSLEVILGSGTLCEAEDR